MALPKSFPLYPADERIPGARVYDDPSQKTARVEFDNWQAFVDYAESRPLPWDRKTYPQSDSRRNAATQRWDLGAGFDGAIKLARDGWADGRDRMAKIAAGHFDILSKSIDLPVVRYDVVGGDFDIDRVLTGDPEAWINFDPVTVDGPGHRVVDMVVNICASGGVGAEVLFARGAVVGALVELLEFAGHSVGVTLDWTGASYGDNCNDFHCRVNVKEPGQPLDMARMAFAVAHPACLRRLGFSVMETTRAGAWWGYGSVVETPADEQGDLYSGSAHLYAPWTSNEDAAKAWIREQLEGQGIKIEQLG